jgi:predicted nucleic acid-binding protein
MNVSAFFDTNIVVYAAAGKDEPKRKRALELVESIDFATSAQVLQEFFVTVVKKVSHPLSATHALEWIEQWTDFPCQTIDHQLVRIAIEQSERFAISFGDGYSGACRSGRNRHGLLGRIESRPTIWTRASRKPFSLSIPIETDTLPSSA